jgi:hypothetical protein
VGPGTPQRAHAQGQADHCPVGPGADPSLAFQLPSCRSAIQDERTRRTGTSLKRTAGLHTGAHTPHTARTPPAASASLAACVRSQLQREGEGGAEAGGEGDGGRAATQLLPRSARALAGREGEGKEAAVSGGPARWNAGSSRRGSGCLPGAAIPGGGWPWAVTARPGPEAGRRHRDGAWFFRSRSLSLGDAVKVGILSPRRHLRRFLSRPGSPARRRHRGGAHRAARIWSSPPGYGVPTPGCDGLLRLARYGVIQTSFSTVVLRTARKRSVGAT